jgi:hypothetical protein
MDKVMRSLKRPELLGLVPIVTPEGRPIEESELQKLRDEWNRLYLSFQLPPDLNLPSKFYLWNNQDVIPKKN